MYVIGLTGGIGSGKSTVAALFKAKGIPVIDADILAHDITQPGESSLKQIVEIFGPEILLSDGHLNRLKLRKIVFSDEVKRKKLEKVLHPLIRHKMKLLAESHHAPYCIAMIPLLLETTPNPLIKRILVVDTSENLQITRVAARDNTSPDEIKNILKAQMSREERLKLTDDTIINNGSYEDLIPQVDKLHELYLYLALS